ARRSKRAVARLPHHQAKGGALVVGDSEVVRVAVEESACLPALSEHLRGAEAAPFERLGEAGIGGPPLEQRKVAFPEGLQAHLSLGHRPPSSLARRALGEPRSRERE